MSNLDIFEVGVSPEAYEPSITLGYFSTEQLANEMRDKFFGLWPDKRVLKEDFFVFKRTLHSDIPEIHTWLATVSVENPEDTQVSQLSAPTLAPAQSNWHLLEKPVRFCRNPLRGVVGSGATPALAMSRAREARELALARGALQRIADCAELVKQAEHLAETRKRASSDSSSNSYSQSLAVHDVLDELALTKFGPDPQ